MLKTSVSVNKIECMFRYQTVKINDDVCICQLNRIYAQTPIQCNSIQQNTWCEKVTINIELFEQQYCT